MTVYIPDNILQNSNYLKVNTNNYYGLTSSKTTCSNDRCSEDSSDCWEDSGGCGLDCSNDGCNEDCSNDRCSEDSSDCWEDSGGCGLDGGGGECSEDGVTPEPEKPLVKDLVPNLSHTILSSSSVEISWGSVTNATQYCLVVKEKATSKIIVDTIISDTSYVVEGLSKGITYLYNCCGRNADDINGPWYDTAKSFKIKILEEWEWDTPKIQGKEINITANEFERFLTRISLVEDYFTITYPDFSYGKIIPSSGTIISAEICEKPIKILQLIEEEIFYRDSNFLGLSSLPEIPKKGDPITASFFNNLRDSLNICIDFINNQGQQ